MSAPLPLGTTKGPGETANEYVFVTPDRAKTAKVGEFVYYEADVDGDLRRVLGRITGRAPLRLLPDGFMADPNVPPEQVAAMVGYADGDPELFAVTVTVLGYYNSTLGDFINPRLPPRLGTPIHIADSAMLADVLSKRNLGEVGAAHIGSLLSRPAGEVPVVLDLRAITSTHLAIIASTGSGKSYLAGVLLEELMRPNNRAAVLIVDPHGEYDTLTEMEGAREFLDDGDGYQPRVEVIRPEDVKVRISSLTIGDLRYLLPELSERMHYVLGRAYNLVQRKFGEKWTLAQFRLAVREAEEQMSGKERSPEEEAEAISQSDDYGTAGAVIWRLNSRLEHSAIFDDLASMRLDKLFKPGQCTVLQLNEVDQREQQVVVATILRRLWQARMKTEKGEATQEDETYLPYPAFVLIEEAHNFAPASADLVSSQILKQVLSEGRKFGVAVGLISQRPGKLDADVLSQCMTQFILRIVNPIDQARVAESIESVGRDLLRELPALSKGQTIVAGAAVNTPVLCRVRSRITEHGAEDIDAPERWRAWFQRGADAQAARDQAILADPGRGRDKLFKT
ncbi:MAG: ATP-binding protein [Anaerolineae bacterium]|nr:ATP-binding protein [Anaerolineae bacterium]